MSQFGRFGPLYTDVWQPTSAMRAGVMAGQINPMNGSASISIPPEIQRILQDGMQSILERSVKDGPAQFEYVETGFAGLSFLHANCEPLYTVSNR